MDKTKYLYVLDAMASNFSAYKRNYNFTKYLVKGQVDESKCKISQNWIMGNYYCNRYNISKMKIQTKCLNLSYKVHICPMTKKTKPGSFFTLNHSAATPSIYSHLNRNKRKCETIKIIKGVKIVYRNKTKQVLYPSVIKNLDPWQDGWTWKTLC